MYYQLIPNLIFFFCILGIIILILRRLPEAQNLEASGTKQETLYEKLEEKGIPAQTFNKFWSKFKFFLHKLWALALEAKDLRPKPGAYQIKRLFQFRTQVKKQPAVIKPPELNQSAVSEEDRLLELIKKEPKEKKHYDELGRYYLNSEKYQDAKDIYLYLAGHEVGNPGFHARLAQAAFLIKDFSLAENHFAKSLALDKMHPNRYYNLGLSQECQEKWAQASENFAKAVEMDPKNQKYLHALERIRNQTN